MYYYYFSQIAVPKAALNILILVAIFSHDCCNLEDKATVEEHRHRYLLLLFECLCQSEGVLGACNVACKLHGVVHHLDRICQVMGQKMVNVKE